MSVEEEFEYLKSHPNFNDEGIQFEDFYGIDPGDFQKLEVLKELSTQKDAVPTVVVDDAVFPRYLKNGINIAPFS